MSFDRNVAIAVAAGFAAGAGVAALYFVDASRRSNSAEAPQGGAPAASTTSSGHSGAVYESSKAVAEYLQFHFGSAKDIMPYADGPTSALGFASRTATLCADWAERVGLAPDAALDVGCAVGRSSFDMTATFSRVVGVDFSFAFIAAAEAMRGAGAAQYSAVIEGDISRTFVARMPSGLNPTRAVFLQGDACALPSESVLGGRFTVVHGANLLCRLPDPLAFLTRLPSLLVPRGLVVLVSPYSWLPAYTAKDRWIGGFVDAAGVAHYSRDGLLAAMTKLGFKLLHEEDVPFLIREHVRKYQWGCSHATIWQLN